MANDLRTHKSSRDCRDARQRLDMVGICVQHTAKMHRNWTRKFKDVSDGDGVRAELVNARVVRIEARSKFEFTTRVLDGLR